MKDMTALIDGDSLIYYEMGKTTLEEALSKVDKVTKEEVAIKESNKAIENINISLNVEKLDPYSDIENLTAQVADQLMEDIKNR